MPTILHRFKILIRPYHLRSSRRHLHRPGHAHSKPETYCHNLKLRSLVRSGNFEAARKLFDHMPERDVVTWNTMIAACWERNDVNDAEWLFGSMPERSVVSWNCMVTGYIETGRIEEAFKYFLLMPERSIASWNAMISGLVKYDRFNEAERLFNEMPDRNVISYTAMVDGFARKGEIERARSLFDWIACKNVVSWAAMISGYVENRKLEEARRLFDQMPEKSVVAFTAMITGYCKEGDMESARILFEELRHKDLISWNVMIAGYAQNNHGEEALRLHQKMVTLGMKPDHTTIVIVLTACTILTSIQSGKQTHAIAIKIRLDSVTSLCNALMTMYSKCGSICDSELIFQCTQSPDIVSWNAIIATYSQHGHYEKTLAMFHELLKYGLKPDGVTFLSILSTCGHVGMVEESLTWFDLMVHEYGVPPGAEHFSCLVDILGRAGKLEKAYHLIMTMPCEADSAVWGALLAACRMYFNVEFGELAAKKMLELDPQNSGAYVMLSNIYAAAGMWRDVTRVRLLMKDQGVQKQGAYSWTEIGDKLHMFMGGDMLHPDIGKIHSELKRISLHMNTRNFDTNMVS